MKSKNKRNALRSLVMSTVLVTSVALSTVPVSAANAELPIAQYVSASGDAQCGTSPETATYTGKVTLKVPLTKIMEANEANMKLAADNGAYPWNKEKTGIAYITYDVTFPEEVQFGNISATETSSFINKVEATTKNNKQVSLKMTFNDVNWEGIYGLYIADKLDPSAHTVDVEIPYTITANSLAEATKYENELITGTGDFTFYTGRSFFSVKTTYNADTLSKPFVSGLSDCFVPAVQPTAQPTAQPAAQPVAQPAAQPTAQPAAQPTAQPAAQPTAQPAAQPTAQPTAQPAAQPTAQPATPAQNAGSSANLEGDILIGNDTQHDKVYEANKTDVLDITGALNVKPIKDELKRLEAQYSAAVTGGISVENIDTSFTASITLPEGMEYTSSNPQAVLEGANGKFEIVSTSLVGKTATVKLSLKDANQITTYQQLSNAVNSVEDTLKVTVKGVKFSATSSPETEYTINGSVRGDFSGKATNIAGGQVINFNYTWAGKQTQAGADFRALNSENIQFTLKYKKDTTPTPSNPDTGRIGGKDRIDTAIKISKDNYDKAKTVIVVRHDLFPDSMTASVLAKLKDAPILLNPTDKLDSRVADEIKRLGAEEIIIVGGQNSVSEKVREDLKAYDADKNVERISGVDRYGTSEMVAKRVTGITGKKHTGVVASGQVFPDALSVGTFASRDGYPILLVKKDSIPSQIQNAIKDLDINKTYIAGGTDTISKSTEAKLPSVVERMAGATRYETSVAIAKSKFAGSKEAYVASGIEFADALVISPISGKYNRPTLLVSNKVNSNQLVRDYVKGSSINKLIAIGGERYVPSSVIDNLVK